jgi:hypothetical protein
MGERRKPRIVEASGTAVGTSRAVATAQVFTPMPDDHPCYALVGLIAAETARIEQMLDGAIWDLAALMPVVGACITGQMVGAFPRYSALFQLAHLSELPAKILDEIKKQMGVSNEVAEKRNRAIHDPWYVEDETGEPHQYRGRTKKDLNFGPHPVSVDQLKDDLAFIRNHKERVRNLRNEIYLKLRPSLEKDRERSSRFLPE